MKKRKKNIYIYIYILGSVPRQQHSRRVVVADEERGRVARVRGAAELGSLHPQDLGGMSLVLFDVEHFAAAVLHFSVVCTTKKNKKGKHKSQKVTNGERRREGKGGGGARVNNG